MLYANSVPNFRYISTWINWKSIEYIFNIKTFFLQLKAVDAQDSSLSSTCSIHIDIHDTNDNDPQFNSKEYKFNVSENSCKGTVVGIINVGII